MTFRHALRKEEGFALPIAIAVLMITLVLAGVATTVAIRTNSVTNRDSSNKAAVEAADAGVRTALYRLNMYRPDDSHCPTVPTAVAVGTSSGGPTDTLCPPDGPEALGNGATFKYWVSRAMRTGDTCAGTTVSNDQATVAQRCITASGTVGNVTARVQERAVAYTSSPVFPTAIFGTKSVSIGNNVNIVSDVPATPALLGTNGTLTVGGGTTVIDGYSIPPGASASLGNGVTNNGPTTPQTFPYPVPTAINVGNTARDTSLPYYTPTTFQGGTCLKPNDWSGNWIQTNCDYRLSTICTQSCDSGSNFTFPSGSRSLTLANNASLTLAGGFYNFCSLTMGNNAQIYVAPLAKVSIFIDSPSDPGSGCPVGSGTFTVNQGASLNAGGSALNLQVYVYGDPTDVPPTNQVSLQNVSSSAFALVAPYSNITLNPSNNSAFTGAMVGYTVTLGQASHFTFESDTKSLQSGSLQLYYRAFWAQCSALASGATDPSASC